MRNKSFVSKLFQVSAPTVLSRILGIIREMLTIRYLGATGMADAFLTAWKVPNSLRKIFAEGAFSASFVPTVVTLLKRNGKPTINRLVTVTVLLFESTVLLLCFCFMIFAPWIIKVIAPGFGVVQIGHAAQFLWILMPFTFLISSSALFAAALQSVDHFLVPALAPVVLNCIFIVALLICTAFSLPVTALCYGIIAGGLIQLGLHMWMYRRLGFTFDSFYTNDLRHFGSVMAKFLWCAPSLGVNEIGLFIDTSFASLLAPGSVSLLYYAHRFVGIPQGIFAIPLSIVLLPHFSRVSLYAPKRLGFYLFEGIKCIWWIALPIIILMIFFSEKIFLTLFVTPGKFSVAQAHEAGAILTTFVAGLFFFALNKILLNVYYALHLTWIPGLVTIGTTGLNVLLNVAFMPWLQATGLALATTLAAGVAQTIILLVILLYGFKFKLYIPKLTEFMARHTLFVSLVVVPFYGMYRLGILGLQQLGGPWSFYLLERTGFWLWVGPLSVCFMLVLWYARPKHAAMKLYLLD